MYGLRHVGLATAAGVVCGALFMGVNHNAYDHGFRDGASGLNKAQLSQMDTAEERAFWFASGQHDNDDIPSVGASYIRMTQQFVPRAEFNAYVEADNVVDTATNKRLDQLERDVDALKNPWKGPEWTRRYETNEEPDCIYHCPKDAGVMTKYFSWQGNDGKLHYCQTSLNKPLECK